MEKPSSTSDSGLTTAYNTVFIDTSLDTHLAMIVSDFDTVSDLKKKILYEHPLCFPNFGEIKIHALKVKRKGYFYHLSDSMFVKSAFDGVNKSWFLSVDASTLEEQNENQHFGKPNSGDLIASFGITAGSAERVGFQPDVPTKQLSNIDDLSLPHVQSNQHPKQKHSDENNADDNCNILFLNAKNGSGRELKEKHYNEDAVTHSGSKEDISRAGINDVLSNESLEGFPETAITSKKHKTKRRSEDEECNQILKEKSALAHVSDEDASQQNTVPDNSLVTEGRGAIVTHDVIYNSKTAVVNMKSNTSLEEVSPRAIGKKRRKTVRKGDNENSLKENRFLACDSTRENFGPEITISQCSFGDKQKGTIAPLDHLSTDMSIDEKLTTSPSSGKRKRKKKSSKLLNEVVAAVPSVQDETRENPDNATGVHHKNLEREPSAAVSTGQGIQNATISEPSSISVKKNICVPLHEVGGNDRIPCSYDANISAKDAGNVESKNKSSELTAASAAKQMKISGDHHVTVAEGHPPLAVQEAKSLNNDTGFTKLDDVIFHDSQKFGRDLTGRVAEGKELSQPKDSDAMPLVKCTSSGRGEIDLNSKVQVASNLFDANANVELDKSSKKRRKSKRSRDSVTSGTEHETGSLIGISSTEPHESVQKDQPSDKSKREETLLSPVKGKEVPKEAAMNTSVLANDGETDNVIRNVLESLKHVSKNPLSTENKNEKSRKKTKRKQSSAGKTLPELSKEDDSINFKIMTMSTDGIRDAEVDASSKLMKKTSSKNKLNGSSLVPESNSVVEICPLQHLNGNIRKSGHTDEAHKKMEVSCESDRTIVNDNFVPSKDKVTKTKGADNKLNDSKDKKKLDVHSNDASPDLQNTLKLYENKRNGGKAQAVTSSSIEPERSLLKGEDDNLKLHPKSKLARGSGTGARAFASNKSDESSKREEASGPDTVNGYLSHTRTDKTKQIIAASSSSLESSKSILRQSKRGNRRQAHLDIGRVSNNNFNGEVVNSSEHKKSLLARSGTIFKEDSDGSSDDEDGVDNSNSSTRTPSDNSLSSDYSDGDSRAQQNGSYASKGKESGRRNITKSYSSVTLEKILRSSSRYKAAKLTAAQAQLEDTESQPLEFVPDSLADQ